MPLVTHGRCPLCLARFSQSSPESLHCALCVSCGGVSLHLGGQSFRAMRTSEFQKARDGFASLPAEKQAKIRAAHDVAVEDKWG